MSEVENSEMRAGYAELCLVSCVSKKNDYPCLARDLYVSPWFVGARRYEESLGVPWYILSAKYGLVAPDQVIAPY